LIPGGSGPGIQLRFDSPGELKQFAVTNGLLAVAGQGLAGDFAFEMASTGPGPDGSYGTPDDVRGLRVGVANASLLLGTAAAGIRITNASGAFFAAGEGLAGTLTGTVLSTIPGVSFGGTFGLVLNTSAAAVDTTVLVGTTPVTIKAPAGPFLRIEGRGVNLTVLGQTLSGDFVFQRATAAGGAAVTTLAASNVALTLGSGSTAIVALRNGSGAFVLNSEGIAGRIGGDITLNLPGAVSLTGNLSLAINNTNFAVDQSFGVNGRSVALKLPAGPYLRFEGLGMELDVLGQKIGGDFAFEQVSDLGADRLPGGTGANADTRVIRLAAANVSLSFGGAAPLATLSNGSGFLLIEGARVAGQIGGTVAVNVPGISFSGTLQARFNTGAAVSTTFMLGTVPVVLDLPAGPYVQLAGTGIAADVLGVRIAGDFTLTRVAGPGGLAEIDVRIANASLGLGGTPAAPVLGITIAAGQFRMTPAGVAGSISGLTLNVNLASVVVAGTFSLRFNTAAAPLAGLPAGPFFRVEGAGVELAVLGQKIGGDFSFEQVAGADGLSIVRVALANGFMTLGTATAGVVVENAGGFLLLTPAGAAASFTASVRVVPATVVLRGTFGIDINTLGSAVNQSFTLNGTQSTLVLPAGPYVRVSGTGVEVAVAGQSLRGDFVFTQTTINRGPDGLPGTADDLRGVRIAVNNVSLGFGDGTVNFVNVTNGSGSFLILPAVNGGAAGIAGWLSATVSVAVPGIAVGGTLRLEINNTNTAVDEVIFVGGLPIELKLVAGNYVRVSGTGVTVALLGTSLRGDFTFERAVVAGATVTRVDFANVEFGLGSEGGELVRVTEGAGSFVLDRLGLRGTFQARAAVDVPGVSFDGFFSVTINTAAGTLEITGTNNVLIIAGQRVEATSFTVARETHSNGSAIVTIAVQGFELAFSDGTSDLLVLSAVSARLVISPDGIGARVTGVSLAANLGGSLGFNATQGDFEMNTARRPFDLDDGGAILPAGPYIRVSVGSATLTVAGIGLTGAFVFDQSTRPEFMDAVALNGAGDNSLAAVAGDIDGDGDRDLIILNAAGVVSYRPNLGTDAAGAFLGFGLAQVLATIPNATSLALGNVNGSDLGADLDLVVGVDGGTNRLLVNRGRSGGLPGAGTWLGYQAPVALGSETDATRAVALADLDNDQDLDLVVANNGVNRVYRNDGAGVFTLASGTSDDASPLLPADAHDSTALALGDFDGDGFLDLVVGNRGTNFLYLNRGFNKDNGDPASTTTVVSDPLTGDPVNQTVFRWQGFGAGQAIGGDAFDSLALALGDFDDDGNLDLAVGNDGQVNRIFPNRGADLNADGSVKLNARKQPVWLGFAAAQNLGALADNTRALAAGDVNNDGLADLVIGNFGQPNLVYRNSGTAASPFGGVTPVALKGGDADTRALVLANFDGDRDPDLAVFNDGPDHRHANEDLRVTRVAADGVALTIDGEQVAAASGAFVIKPGGIAGVLTGSVQFSAGGSFGADAIIGINVNTTGERVEERIQVGARVFDIALNPIASPGFEVFGSGLIQIGGFITIRVETGSASSGTGSVFVGEGTPFDDAGNVLPNLTGVLLLNASFAQDAGGNFAATGTVRVLGLAGIELDGDVTLVYTAAAGIGRTLSLGLETINLPDNPTTMVRLDGFELALAGQRLAGDFEIAFSGTPAAREIRLVVKGASIGFGDGTTEFVTLSAVNGELLVLPAGLAGIVEGTLNFDLPTDAVDLGAGISARLLINNTPDPRLIASFATTLPGGPYTRIEANLAGVSILGNTFGGAFFFEQVVGELSPEARRNPDAKPPMFVRAGASGVNLFLGDAGANAGLRLVNGDLLFLMTPAGLAGTLGGAIEVLVPGNLVEFEANLRISFNTGTAGVAEEFTVNGGSASLILPGGPYFRAEGTGVKLRLLQQLVSGDFIFEQVTVGGASVVRVVANNVTAAFGNGVDPFIQLARGYGFLRIGAAGLAGEVGGDVTVAVPGISLTGSLALQINNGTTGDVLESVTFGPQHNDSRTAVVGDVNGDARPDLIVGNFNQPNLLYINDGSGNPFDLLSGIPIGSHSDPTVALALVDVNGDGFPDLVAGNNGAPNRLYFNNGQGVFTHASGIDLGNGATTAVLAVDLTGDERPELVIGVDGAPDRVFRNLGLNTTTSVWNGFAAVETFGATGATRALTAADFNGDGLPDVVVGLAGGETRLFLNRPVAAGVWPGFAAVQSLGANVQRARWRPATSTATTCPTWWSRPPAAAISSSTAAPKPAPGWASPHRSPWPATTPPRPRWPCSTSTPTATSTSWSAPPAAPTCCWSTRAPTAAGRSSRPTPAPSSAPTAACPPPTPAPWWSPTSTAAATSTWSRSSPARPTGCMSTTTPGASARAPRSACSTSACRTGRSCG
jgi:hypothetical protein